MGVVMFCTMFVRKKKGRSGATSVVVVDKYQGKFKELKSMGVGKTEVEIDVLCLQAKDG